MLILYNYIKLSLKLENSSINRFLYKKNVWKLYIMRKLRYGKKVLIIKIIF